MNKHASSIYRISTIGGMIHVRRPPNANAARPRNTEVHLIAVSRLYRQLFDTTVEGLKVTYMGLGLIGRPDTHNHTSVKRGMILMVSQSPGNEFRQSAQMLRPQTAKTGALKGIKTVKSSASVDMRLYRDV
jgi:hypothetical protein